MSESKLKTDEIKLKVTRLLDLYKSLKTEYDTLHKENEEHKSIIKNQKNTILSLEERNKIIKLAESLGDSKEDNRELKKKVNSYLREIDECIRLLSDR